MGITKRRFGSLRDGSVVDLFTLRAGEIRVEVTNFGGIITRVITPDKRGGESNVVHGFDTLEEYLAGCPYFGCIVGRYANRIAGGSFQLDGRRLQLARNDGRNHLHGGLVGFDKVLWGAEIVGDALKLHRISPDGEEGYPGNLDAVVTYGLTDKGELRLLYNASTDAPTILNLTNHSYFNLEGEGDVLGHEVLIDADCFTPAGQGLIPTGEVRSVDRTPMDFRLPSRIGDRISSQYEQLILGSGFDCNWALNGEAGKLRRVVTVHAPGSGRTLEVSTTQPGLQFYTGNHLDGRLSGKGKVYGRWSGLCLETQHYPDSPNRPVFPSTVLRPGERYHEETVLKFYAE